MSEYTNHTIYLQDGSLFNFKRRFKRQHHRLATQLAQVYDGRSKYGKRYPLPVILLLLLGGITAGNTTIKDCQLWAMHNRTWLVHLVDLVHGIPDARTISRAIQKTGIDSLVVAFRNWVRLMYGADQAVVASFDGKTMRGVHGKAVIKHILSLLTHGTNQILGQVGVTQKENEIPALPRLLDQVPSRDIAGLLLLGDALHTQKETIKHILSHKADYLLFVKSNQGTLYNDLALFFRRLPFGTVVEKTQEYDPFHGRTINTTVTTSQAIAICAYLKDQGWEGVRTVGMITRSGNRTTKDGVVVAVDETVYCLSSRRLTAAHVATHTKDHWQIENNLHWQKDWLFLEDRQTLRCGVAPQVMTFLRSVCLSLFHQWQFTSPATAISNLQKSSTLHQRFLTIAAIV